MNQKSKSPQLWKPITARVPSLSHHNIPKDGTCVIVSNIDYKGNYKGVPLIVSWIPYHSLAPEIGRWLANSSWYEDVHLINTYSHWRLLP